MILQGNSIRIPLKDNSVHWVVTSPPYWNLRNYNVSGQIGLEPTIAAYIAVMVQVFREVWRVLRPDGVCWVNLGDSYSGGKNGRSAADTRAAGNDDRTFRDKPFSVTELPAKNLCMIPARVAIALQDDGWILRSELPWVKSNAMPSSVTDRPGTAHEHVFMLVKSARYYYDNEANRRRQSETTFKRFGNGVPRVHGTKAKDAKPGEVLNVEMDTPLGILPNGRAFRTSDLFFDSLDAAIAHLQDVRDNGGMLLDGEGMPGALVVNSEAYAASHYATFPRKLVAPLVKMSPEKCCPECGKPWQRVIEKTGHINNREPAHVPNGSPTKVDSTGWQPTTKATSQWQPTCKCGLPESECAGGVILDCFAGSGTVGEVCREHGRRFIGIDLSATYLSENALSRAEKKTSAKLMAQLPMFREAA